MTILSRKGVPTFPINKNEKTPSVSGGFKSATTDIDTIEDWYDSRKKSNIAMPTGAVSKYWVLDVDVKNGAKGLESLKKIEYLLGKLDTFTVRTPSGGIHLYFKYPKKGVKCLTNIFDGIDVRGDGGYVLIPPSSIDGEKYKVENKSEVSIAPKLLYILLRYGQKALPPIDISEGERNDKIFKYMCSLRDLGVSKADRDKIAIALGKRCGLDEEEAISCANSSDRYDDEKKSKPVPEEDRQSIVDDFNKEYAATFFGSKCVVLYESYYPMKQTKDVYFTDFYNLRSFYANKTIPNGRGGIDTYADVWWRSPNRRQYKGVVFMPNNAPDDYYNLWGGYGVESKKGNCDLFLKHIRNVICNNDNETYNYVIGWMASMIQNPSERLGTALVLRGKQGVGKGRFVAHLGALLGKSYLHVSNVKHVTNHFNSHLKDKCLVFADEAVWEGQGRTSEGNLKSLITEDTLMIEPKGKDALSFKNNIWLILASNYDDPVKVSAEERRFVILDVSDKYMQDKEYFKKLERHMMNGGREALLYYLLNYDISESDLTQIPQTKALDEMKRYYMDDMQTFWYDRLDDARILERDKKWTDWVSTKDLFDQYCSSIGRASSANKSMETKFGIEFKKMLPVHKVSKKKVGDRQVRGYMIPSLKKCRRHFEKIMRTQYNWDE